VEVEAFLEKNEVYKVFYICPEINIAKNYSREDLNKIGILLNQEVDSAKRIFRDNKYNFKWQEQFSGTGDAYTGYFKVIEPVINDTDLCIDSI